MKKFTFLFSLMIILINCTPQNSVTKNQDKENTAMKPEKNDDGEWDLQVIDIS